MTNNSYQDFAEHYDWMKNKSPDQDEFFRELFKRHQVKNVLDCACGTGHELILFNSFGCEVEGSDLSNSMLNQARKNLLEAAVQIPLNKIDFRYLDTHFKPQFDAVVCLSNSINELLKDADTLTALKSMRTVLRDGGILIFDQGQTDASMKNPPKYVPIVNDRDFSRLFVIEYSEELMEVHILDFIHSDKKRDFKHNSFIIRIRLKDSWEQMLNQAGFTKLEYFGDWQFTPYDKEQSQRLIVLAHK
jgi:sarcosine/dimethylglycine N-methyltransferase